MIAVVAPARSGEPVVITGVGAVSPLGNSLTEIADNLLAGHCGIRDIDPGPLSREPRQFAAPVTALPTVTSTGTLSPVTSDMSIALVPCSTTPSVAIRSPGRTTNRSPTRSAAIGTACSVPSARSTEALSAARESSARNAPPARRLAR